MKQKQSLTRLKMLLFHFHATNTIVLSFLPLYLAYKGLSGTEIGWVLAIGPFASLISQPFWGFISDKYKTVKRMLILSIIGMLLTSVVFFQMNHLLAILFFGAILYFFSSPVGALSDSLAQRRANELHISFGTIRTWGSIGFAFSSLFVGQLLSHIGVQYIFIPYVLIGLILLILSFTIEDITPDETPVRLHDVSKMLRERSFMYFLLIMMFITISHRANDSFIGIYIAELGGSESIVGLAWFIGVISEAIVFALSSFWFRRFHPIIFIIIAGFLYTVRWFIYGYATSPTVILLFQVMHGLTFGLFYVAAFDFITRIIPQALQATGHLIFYSVLFGVSGIVGSMGGGIVIEYYSGSMLYIAMGGLSFIGLLSFVIYYFRIGKREALNDQSYTK